MFPAEGGYHAELVRADDCPTDPTDPERWNPVGVLRVPGRANLIGEHMDYNGGHSIPFPIGRALTFTISCTQRTDECSHVIIGPTDQGAARWLMLSKAHENCPRSAPKPSHLTAPLPHRFSPDERRSGVPYILGAWALSQAGSFGAPHASPPLEWPTGFDICLTISGDLPAGSGLSSSAALSIGLLIALRHARETALQLKRRSAAPEGSFRWSAPRHLDTNESRLALAQLAQLVEHRYAGTPCGLMDQLAIVMTPSSRQTYLQIAFAEPMDASAVTSSHADHTPSFSAFEAHPVFDHYDTFILHSGKEHDLSDGQYASRRKECQAALRTLNDQWNMREPTLCAFFRAALGHEKASAFKDIKGVSDLINQTNWPSEALGARARYVAEEFNRVDQAVVALKEGDALRMNQLLNQAQDGLANDYAVSCPEIDSLVTLMRELANQLEAVTQGHGQLPALLGPRMMGGGFGGSLVLLVHQARSAEFSALAPDRLTLYKKQTGCEPRLFKTHKAAGITWQAN